MFDLRRFLRLAVADWVENRRAWAWFLFAGIVVHFLLVLVLLANDNGYRMFDHDGQQSVFLAGLFTTAPIFAGRYFQAMARPGPALLALMRPASAFEKWLLAVLVVAVAYPVAYHLAFFVCDLPATLIARAQAATALVELDAPSLVRGEVREYQRASLQPDKFALFAVPGTIDARGWLAIVLSVTSLQAFAVAGSLIFRRMPFIKTLLAGFLVLLACLLVSIAFDSRPDAFFGYWTNERMTWTAAQSVVFPIAWFLVPGLLWLCAFLALRERELA
jgi:hypothetical protein